MNYKALIIAVLVFATAAFAAAAWYITRAQPVGDVLSVPPQVAEALIRPHSPILGPEDAPVTIYEFFDPACEACRAFHPIVKDIMAQHGDKVRVAIRYTPFHGEASEVAIRVLEAARMQGRFEPVLEALLQMQPRWAAHGNARPEFILEAAALAGLDKEAALTQMQAPDVVAVLNQDRADVAAVGVRKTPTFFVNGKPVEPFGEAELRALVAAEVAAVGS